MDDVAHALDDWAVKEKFVFRTECRDAELPGFVRRKAAPSEVTVARSRQQRHSSNVTHNSNVTAARSQSEARELQGLRKAVG
ncbi:hypothetical protein GMDG_03837 [Pseudogymnoascus destructans 20631-21]|uniref:Uncharacterized protein n=1 Tax=Pseudogymnoascus destructans (strain ATCC MYA-4855 / 20631-21) TaxID=658429 RepID=L8G849_PSED2|nr:hypothetical protein GMDG_03837 [Pseudogymnoascus destructans 20631-21]